MLFTHIHSPVVCSAVFLNNRPRHNEAILLHKMARSSGQKTLITTSPSGFSDASASY